MWRYHPTEGYDPRPILEDGKLAFGLVIGLWSLLVLTMAFLILWFRHLPSIAHRSPLLTAVGAVPAILNGFWIFWRPLLGGDVGCAMELWLVTLCFSSWTFLNFARCLRLLFLYRSQEALLDRADQPLSTLPSHLTRAHSDTHPSPYAPNSLVLQLGATPSKQPPLPTHWGISAPSREWWLRYRSYLTETALLPAVVIATALFLLLACGIVQVLGAPAPIPSFPDPLYAHGQCMVDWPFWPSYILLFLLSLLIYPILIFSMRDAQDAYGCRREILAHVLAKILAIPVYLLFCFIPAIPQHIRTPLIMTTASLLILFGTLTTLALPLVDALHIHHSRASITFSVSAFYAMLADPILFPEFLLFSVRDFSVENALFHRRYARLIHPATSPLASPIASPIASPLSSPRTSRVPTLYTDLAEVEEMYNTYLRRGAPFELNIDLPCRDRFQARWDAGEHHISTFAEVAEQVQRNMLQHTYPRYLAHTRGTNSTQ